MGYGNQAIKFLQAYYSGEYSPFKEIPNETIEEPIKNQVKYNFLYSFQILRFLLILKIYKNF